jgi:mannose/fructose/N-acetylgalactosamine-specific phosphotransferase system component IIC
VQDVTPLQKLSGVLYWIALVLSVLLPLVVLLYAGKAVTDPASLLSRAPTLAPDTPVSVPQAGLVAAIALAAVLPMVAALRAMVRLFARYREGEVLSPANAETILQIGRALVLVALFTVLVPTLQTLILSWNASQKTFSIGLDGGTLGFLMAAGLLTVIGWAMREAAAVKAENEGFV